MKRNYINILESRPLTSCKSIMSLRLILLIYLSLCSAYKIFSQELSKEEIINGLYLETIDFKTLDNKWKKDADVAMHAVFKNGLNLEYVDADLRKNNNVIQSAIWENAYSMIYADGNILKNIDSVRDIFDDSEIEQIMEGHSKMELYDSESKRQLALIFRNTYFRPIKIVWSSVISEVVLNEIGIAENENENSKNDSIAPFPSIQEILEDSSSIVYAFNLLPPQFQRDMDIITNVFEVDHYVLGLIDKSLRDNILSNKELILRGLKNSSEVLKYVPSSLMSDKSFILKALEVNGGALEYVSKAFKRDKEIVLVAVKRSGYALDDADESLKKDREIVLEAVKSYGYAFRYADESLKKDRDFVLEVLKSSGYAFEYADESLKKDKGFVFEAVKRSGLALEYADESLKKDRKIVLEAVKNDGKSLQFADESLQNDPKILKACKNINN